jgi:transposase
LHYFCRAGKRELMPKLFHLHRPDLAPALRAAWKKCAEVKDQQRLLAMRMAASGQFTAAQIAEQIGISRRQFFNWVEAFKQGGVHRLLAREHGGGAPPQVQGPILEELLAGLQAGQWKRARDIQHWLQHRHQVRLALPGVFYWLGKLGGVLKVPRKTHAKKDAAQASAFQQQLCAKLKSLNIASGTKVRIWVLDEHRYGLISVVRKCWTLRGLRPAAPYQTKYQWGYLYSALEVDGEHAAQFQCLPGVSLELSRLFLEQLAERDPQAEHVVIADQAGFHLNPKLHPLPPRIHVVPLPPYSPELNPVEAIGDLVKDRIGNALWTTLEKLEAAIAEELEPIYQSAERVRRLVSHGWLIAQVNTTAAENSAITC